MRGEGTAEEDKDKANLSGGGDQDWGGDMEESKREAALRQPAMPSLSLSLPVRCPVVKQRTPGGR